MQENGQLMETNDQIWERRMRDLDRIGQGIAKQYEEMIAECDQHISDGIMVNDWRELKLKCTLNLIDVKK